MPILLELEPLQAAGSIRLGATRTEVRATMQAAPTSFQKSSDNPLVDAWHDGALQVFYSEADAVEFVEISLLPLIRPVFRGLAVLALPAEVVVAELDRLSPYDRSDPEVGYTFLFREWQLCLWRPALPTDAPEEARFFRTVGMGVAGYFP